jgi:fumarate reductase flavoprotein subunit
VNIDVDVIVVGAGGGGLVTGLAAADSGASVVVLEKLDQAGGNTRLSTGSIPGAGTRQQLAAGVEDEPDRMYADLMRQSGPHEGAHLTRRLADVSADLIDWLVDKHHIELTLIMDYKHVGCMRRVLAAVLTWSPTCCARASALESTSLPATR